MRTDGQLGKLREHSTEPHVAVYLKDVQFASNENTSD